MKTLLLALIVVFGLSANAQQAPLNLKLNLEKNKTYRLKSSSTINQKQVMQGMEQVTDMTNDTWFSLKPLSFKEDFFLAEVKFDTLKLSNSMPKMEVSSANEGDYSSAKPEEILQCAYNRLSKSTFLVKFAHTGHVIDIMNYDINAKNILEGIESIQGQMAMMIKPRIEMMAEKDAIKTMIESLTVYLPNKEVNKGDNWDVQFTIKNGPIAIYSKMNFLLEDFQDNAASIKGKITLEPAPCKPADMNGAKISGEMRGLGESDMQVDQNTGWVIKSNSNMQLKGNLNISMQGQEMQMPMEMKMQTEINSLD